MPNPEHYRGGIRTPGAKVKEFLAWLRGLWSPKYIPQRSRYGNGGRKIPVEKFDFGTQLEDEGRWQND
jgi:hypothetical protein